MQRCSDVANKKWENLSSSRAQKQNRLIVNDYFDKTETTIIDMNVMRKPQSIYNVENCINNNCAALRPVEKLSVSTALSSDTGDFQAPFN